MNPKYKEATEEFFGLRGWKWQEWDDFDSMNHEPTHYQCWVSPDGCKHDPDALPNICESMTDWIKYMAEFMRFQRYRMSIDEIWVGGVRHDFVEWKYKDDDKAKSYKTIIKDNEILLASVLAANEYLKGEQHGKVKPGGGALRRRTKDDGLENPGKGGCRV